MLVESCFFVLLLLLLLLFTLQGCVGKPCAVIDQDDLLGRKQESIMTTRRRRELTTDHWPARVVPGGALEGAQLEPREELLGFFSIFFLSEKKKSEKWSQLQSKTVKLCFIDFFFFFAKTLAWSVLVTGKEDGGVVVPSRLAVPVQHGNRPPRRS